MTLFQFANKKKTQCFVVVVQSQVNQAHLVQGSPQVVHALLAFSTQLHVAPQEGETLTNAHTHANTHRQHCPTNEGRQ